MECEQNHKSTHKSMMSACGGPVSSLFGMPSFTSLLRDQIFEGLWHTDPLANPQVQAYPV